MGAGAGPPAMARARSEAVAPAPAIAHEQGLAHGLGHDVVRAMTDRSLRGNPARHEGVLLHAHDEPMALGRSGSVRPRARQKRLRDVDEPIRPRFRGSVFACRVERLHDERRFVRMEPRLEPHHPVRAADDLHPARSPVAARAHHLLDAAADALEPRGGAVLRQVEEPAFILRRGDSRHRADFRVAHLGARESGVDQRQLPERLGHADFLPRRDRAEAHAPIEPGRHRRQPVLPVAAARVELADERQEPVLGRVELGGEGRDLMLDRLVGELRDIGCVHLGNMPNSRGRCNSHRR